MAADLAVFTAHGHAGTGVVTVVTAQDRDGVHARQAVPAALLEAQLAAVWREGPPAAVKIGLLADAGQVAVVAAFLAARRGAAGTPPVVLDPVLGATAGGAEADEATVAALARTLVAQVDLVTPNAVEAARLRAAGAPDGAPWLVTGSTSDSVRRDALTGAGPRRVFERPDVPGGPFHGTGCALSSAVAVHLARGAPLPEAVRAAGDWVHRRIQAAAEAGTWLLPPVDPGD